MILAPATMTAEKDPKTACDKCLMEINLEPDQYRAGHIKARILPGAVVLNATVQFLVGLVNVNFVTCLVKSAGL